MSVLVTFFTQKTLFVWGIETERGILLILYPVQLSIVLVWFSHHPCTPLNNVLNIELCCVCTVNNLLLNLNRTKVLIVDFRMRKAKTYTRLHINSAKVE